MTGSERFPYSPLPERPRLSWPGGARVALWVLPNIEHYEYRPPLINGRDPWPRAPHPDVLNYGLRDYGNRVGVWRMFDCLDRHDIRSTISLNFGVIEHYPDIWEAMEARQCDYLCHGLYNTRYLWNLPEDEERDVIRDCVGILRKANGTQLNGWFGPAVSGTLRTADLAAEHGIGYIADYYHDDQPMPIRTTHGDLVSVPYSMEINDAVVYRNHTEGEEFERMIRDTFDVLYAEGKESGRVMAICLHPYLYGQPHRVKYLDRALGYILGHEGVWQATGTEIAQWSLEHWLPQLQPHFAQFAEGPSHA
ncbi:MAG: polysaccharide deacetylase family protein [Alphaproteobacteria bacterium]|nr:polysaccharide deacetylase family protein [Alphaproteobacteria bacterium]